MRELSPKATEGEKVLKFQLYPESFCSLWNVSPPVSFADSPLIRRGLRTKSYLYKTDTHWGFPVGIPFPQFP